MICPDCNTAWTTCASCGQPRCACWHERWPNVTYRHYGPCSLKGMKTDEQIEEARKNRRLWKMLQT